MYYKTSKNVVKLSTEYYKLALLMLGIVLFTEVSMLAQSWM